MPSLSRGRSEALTIWTLKSWRSRRTGTVGRTGTRSTLGTSGGPGNFSTGAAFSWPASPGAGARRLGSFGFRCGAGFSLGLPRFLATATGGADSAIASKMGKIGKRVRFRGWTRDSLPRLG